MIVLIFEIILILALIILAIIDFYKQILPDQITLPFIGLGILINLKGLFCPIQSAIIGACLGYISLWVIGWIFYCYTGKIGIGNGDFKLFAMLGAWLGWQMLPLILLIASVSGTVIGSGLIIFKQQSRAIPIAFGPYLALAGWIGLLWGKTLNQLLF